MTRLLSFGIYLLQSPYAGAMIWEKIFGSDLPANLTKEWLKYGQACILSNEIRQTKKI